MYHNFLVHSSASGHLGCFHVLAIVNSAAMNIGVHVSFSIVVFLGYVPSNRSAGSLGFPGSSDSKESTYNAGDPGLIPGLGRSPGEGNGYPLQ